jgi:hypothetical protein
MIDKTRAAIVGFLQSVTLDHGAHGAVKDEHFCGEQGGKFGSAIGLHQDYLGKTGDSGDAAKTNGVTNRKDWVCERR